MECKHGNHAMHCGWCEDQAELVEKRAQVQRIRSHLGCEDRDAHTDPVDVIKMIQEWEADAQRRAELLEQHLRAVLEVARTWQPHYATQMDRDTLQYAEDFADRKTPN